MKLKYWLVSLLFTLSARAEPINLLLDWYPNPDHIPLFVGEELGFFKEEGVDLKIIKILDRPQALPFLEARRADIALYCAMPLLRAAAISSDLAIVGSYFDEPLMGFAVLEESGIKSPKDFQGRTIGSTLDGTVAAVLRYYSHRESIEYGDIKSLQTSMLMALAMKKVDVISGIFWNVEPFMFNALGVKTQIFTFRDLGIPRYPELLFVTRKSWAKENEGRLEAFLRALERSIRHCQAHPDAAFDLYAKKMVDKSRKTLLWERESWHATLPLLSCHSAIDPQEILGLYAWMDENGLLRRRYPIEQLFLNAPQK